MTKSSNSEIAERINLAIDLLRKSSSKDKVLIVLMEQFVVSRRQAYRYVQQAQKTKHKLIIPEQKEVFTVKLPPSLVSHLRRFADLTGESLSNIVTQALKLFLKKKRE